VSQNADIDLVIRWCLGIDDILRAWTDLRNGIVFPSPQLQADVGSAALRPIDLGDYLVEDAPFFLDIPGGRYERVVVIDNLNVVTNRVVSSVTMHAMDLNEDGVIDPGLEADNRLSCYARRCYAWAAVARFARRSTLAADYSKESMDATYSCNRHVLSTGERAVCRGRKI
jgi:hypothetical protein